MKTNNKAAREAAARERAKTTSIYNKLADIAREAFDLLTIEPGTYTPAKVAEAINKSRAFWREAATAEADERAAERARVLADIDRRQREERRREEKREAERKEAARRAARREEIKEKAAEILATASADLLAEYMTDAPALCLATACRDIDINEAAEILAELTAAPADDHQDTDTAEPVSEPTAAPAADDLTADELAERLEAEARRFEAVRRIAARRRALLIRMTTGGRGKTAEAWKFARVTLSAFDEKTVTVWAVGMTETIYTRTYRINKEGRRVEVRHNYTTENTAAAAGWLRSIHRAALLNGWALTITTAKAADVKEADTLARVSQFVPGVDRLADTFERMADHMEAERAAAPAADDHQDTAAEVISEDTTPAPAADDSQDTTTAEPVSEPTADALPVTYYDPAAGVIVWGLADELPTADGLTAESVTAADLLTIESERESAAPADDHQDTTTTAHDSESRPRALLLTITRAAVRLAAVVAALLLLTFANDRPTPATATTTAADLLAPADHQDTAAEVISEPTESEPTARPAADRPAVEKRHHGRENKRESRAELMTAAAPAGLLTADTLTAPAVVISESESADTTTARPLLTADELADLLALLTGTTTAESVTAAPAADDSQDTPAEVISEPTESEPTAAPADGHQDTPATTGTTTTPAPAAGSPAAVATPCPPAATVAPVAPIIL